MEGSELSDSGVVVLTASNENDLSRQIGDTVWVVGNCRHGICWKVR